MVRAVGWGWMWVGLLVTAAAVLYGLAVATFNRSMGRVPRGARPRRVKRTKTPLRCAGTAAG